jgi:hypothetical protein
MDTNVNYSKEMAVAYVMSKRYELKDMKSWLFGQIGPKGVKQKPPQKEEEMSPEQIAEIVAQFKAANPTFGNLPGDHQNKQ